MFDSLGEEGTGTDAGVLLRATEVGSWLERLTRTTLHDSTHDTGSDPERTEAELVEVISGLESLKAAAAAAQATATRALEQATTRRRANAGITSRRRQEAGLGAQIALARRDAVRAGNRPSRVETLADDLQPEVVEAAERGQVGTGEARPRGSGRDVGVFRVDSVRTSILGRPRPTSRDRRAPTTSQPAYILIWEEPLNLASRVACLHGLRRLRLAAAMETMSRMAATARNGQGLQRSEQLFTPSGSVSHTVPGPLRLSQAR
ncbi:MAG TPA: hypothetical protein VFM50_10435 [Nocardioidaceae bacterium]|nr:hypothetical protein [Nocardioidaceae bacterium]